MSIIGDWGLCKKSSYDILQTSVITGDLETAKAAIEIICRELEGSISEMKIASCSGEVFIALFDYFKDNFELDVRARENFSRLGEIWRETTGDYDMILFTEKERSQFLPLDGTIDFDEIIQFVDDYFQADYGEAGKIACCCLFEHLKKQQPDDILIWRLF